MLVLRLDFQNGLHLEFNYADVRYATEVFQRVQSAMKEGDLVEVIDDAGRHNDMRGALIQSVCIVDPKQEAESILTLNAYVAKAQPAVEVDGAARPATGAPVAGWLGH